MVTRPHIVFYSTNTWLSFAIAEKFYGGRHYFWCTPFFDPRKSSGSAVVIPPSSSPSELYSLLAQEVKRGDLHSAKISQNRAGIVAGAAAKRKKRVIGKTEFDEIVAIVDAAQVQDFHPLLFVVPASPMVLKFKPVPVRARAHPLSLEFVFDEVPRLAFDVIELPE